MVARRVLMLGGQPNLFAKAAGIGLDIDSLRNEYAGEPDIADHCSDVVIADLTDVTAVEELVLRMHRVKPFDRVVSHAEPLQRLTGYLTSLLALPGNSFETVTVLRDKFALRQRMQDKGHADVAFALVRRPEELRQFLAEHSRAVVKPRNGLGSIGVLMVDEADDLTQVWSGICASGLGEVLVEERLEGVEISVEAFTVRGTHYPLAPTSKLLTRQIEYGHAVPAPITDEDFAAACRLTVAVLDAAELVEGPSHTEIMLTPNDPALIESHSRRGGGKINDLVALSCGLDMERQMWEFCADPDEYRMPLPTKSSGGPWSTSAPEWGKCELSRGWTKSPSGRASTRSPSGRRSEISCGDSGGMATTSGTSWSQRPIRNWRWSGR